MIGHLPPPVLQHRRGIFCGGQNEFPAFLGGENRFPAGDLVEQGNLFRADGKRAEKGPPHRGCESETRPRDGGPGRYVIKEEDMEPSDDIYSITHSDKFVKAF